MNNETYTVDKTSLQEQPETKETLIKRFVAWSLLVIAFVVFIVSLQSYGFYSRYQPRIESANQELYEMVAEKTRMDLQRQIQDQFRFLISASLLSRELSFSLNNLNELLNEHFSADPIGTLSETHTGLLQLKENMQNFSDIGNIKVIQDDITERITQLVAQLEKLIEIYKVPYEELQADLENPPLYLRPMANILARSSGYINSVIFNRAIYISQLGELGTARVLLMGLHASARDNEFLSMVYYALGRLQWQLYLSNGETDSYFQTVEYLRQSMQSNPHSSLPKKFFDYILSLSEGEEEAPPPMGEGEASPLSEDDTTITIKDSPMF